MQKVDFLIVGQGIAGSVLAWTLRNEGHSFRIVDDSRPSSSRVAAGICNPVTGRKLSKTWQADVLFPYLHAFYTQLERELEASFFHPIPVYRPYQSIEEQNFFIAQTANPGLENYVRIAENDQSYQSLIHNELGGLETLQSAWVNLPVLLTEVRKILVQENSFIESEFHWEDIQRTDDHIRWQNIEARYIISCEGAYGRFNPFFSWLPWAVVKGEMLTLSLPEDSVPGIVNQSIWMLPQGNGQFRTGATYEWHDLTWEPSAKARIYLEEKLTKLLKKPYVIDNQLAGIRPATQGRRPFIGVHPHLNNVGIFNGLGSKGTSMAPFLAKQFADFLVHKKELYPEVNIQRFDSLYFSSITA